MEGGITKGDFGRATRTTAVMAIFAAVLMLGIPSFSHSALNNDLAPVGQVAAAGNPGNRVITLGQTAFTEAIQTLNPLTFTMGVEFEVFYPCYSTILTYDVDGVTLVGDLARTWSISPNGLFWNITLTPNAKFYDRNLAPGSFHTVTAQDVAFSFYINRNNSLSYYHSYFPDINGQNVVTSITAASTYEVRIVLSSTYAPFPSALNTIPIFPEYIWTGEKWDWPNFSSTKAPIVGSGPFFYNLSGLPQTGLVELDKNPYWHGTAEHGYEVRFTFVPKPVMMPTSTISRAA
jgi:ABC-type transport system substrate-binding protein